MKQLLIEKIQSKSLITNREITLSSGLKSNYYINCKKVTLNPDTSFLIGSLFYNEIKDLDADAIGGLTFGADAIALSTSLTAYRFNKYIKAFSIRKQDKSHGTKQRIEGDIKAGNKVIIVEDVITTGKSAIEAIETAVSYGLIPIKVIALVDRQQNGITNIKRYVDCISILTLDDIIKK